MKVFVAGATGVLGRALIPMLVNDGHEVVALVRGEEKAALVEEMGARTVQGDVLDADSLLSAVQGSEVVLHIATAIPKNMTVPNAWDANDRVRIEGTRNLLAAAQSVKAKLYVQQSITFLYGNCGDQWLTEQSPVADSLAPHLQSAKVMENLVQASDIPWVILRGGSFYGPGTGFVANVEAARRNELKTVGDGSHFLSLIHVEDMAEAFRLTLKHRPVQRIYNVVDNLPMRQLELFEELALRMSSKQPQVDPQGNPGFSVRCLNNKIRQELGFALKYDTFATGLYSMLETEKATSSST